ncbi:protein of unknown function [Hyphomicrobium sp. MC1]|nr:protein of unknown function [Hyphomicrobium sp. MC1]
MKLFQYFVGIGRPAKHNLTGCKFASATSSLVRSRLKNFYCYGPSVTVCSDGKTKAKNLNQPSDGV